MGVWSWLHRNVKDASLMKKVGIFLLCSIGTFLLVGFGITLLSAVLTGLTDNFFFSELYSHIANFDYLIAAVIFLFWGYIIFYKVPKKP